MSVWAAEKCQRLMTRRRREPTWNTNDLNCDMIYHLRQQLPNWFKVSITGLKPFSEESNFYFLMWTQETKQVACFSVLSPFEEEVKDCVFHSCVQWKHTQQVDKTLQQRMQELKRSFKQFKCWGCLKKYNSGFPHKGFWLITATFQ